MGTFLPVIMNGRNSLLILFQVILGKIVWHENYLHQIRSKDKDTSSFLRIFVGFLKGIHPIFGDNLLLNEFFYNRSMEGPIEGGAIGIKDRFPDFVWLMRGDIYWIGRNPFFYHLIGYFAELVADTVYIIPDRFEDKLLLLLRNHSCKFEHQR